MGIKRSHGYKVASTIPCANPPLICQRCVLLQYSVPQSPLHAMGPGAHDGSSYDSDTSCMSNLSLVVSPHASGSPGTAFAAGTPMAGVSYCNASPFYWQRVVSPETMESLPFFAAGGYPAISSPMMGSPHYGCAPQQP